MKSDTSQAETLGTQDESSHWRLYWLTVKKKSLKVVENTASTGFREIGKKHGEAGRINCCAI
jgi:hypothetical protein